MFSDQGVNGYMKTRDWNVLNKEILQIFLHLFNFMYVLKFFNKKVFWAFKLEVQYISNKPLLTSLALLVKILIFTLIFSISNFLHLEQICWSLASSR